MPLHTRVFTAALDRFGGRSIVGKDLPGIRRSRAKVTGSWGGNGSRLAVCGDSAGGNLSAIVCQVIRDEGGPTIAHQALMYPGIDATLSQPSIVEHADAPILSRASIDVFLQHYLGPHGLTANDPLISPLWATSHANLPPALVQTADLDPLRDEGKL